MIKGYWVLLDELNLASQQVLEGLNALLDHRREIYIPELDRVVNCAPSFRLFAAQNPMADGGGRRGIPRSFLNRFSRISVESLKDEDLENISLFTLENVNHSNQEHSTTICKAVIKTIQAVKVIFYF
jgi:midasin